MKNVFLSCFILLISINAKAQEADCYLLNEVMFNKEVKYRCGSAFSDGFTLIDTFTLFSEDCSNMYNNVVVNVLNTYPSVINAKMMFVTNVLKTKSNKFRITLQPFDRNGSIVIHVDKKRKNKYKIIEVRSFDL